MQNSRMCPRCHRSILTITMQMNMYTNGLQQHKKKKSIHTYECLHRETRTDTCQRLLQQNVKEREVQNKKKKKSHAHFAFRCARVNSFRNRVETVFGTMGLRQALQCILGMDTLCKRIIVPLFLALSIVRIISTNLFDFLERIMRISVLICISVLCS